MKSNERNIEFLSLLADAASVNTSAADITANADRLFKTFLKADKTEFILLNKTADTDAEFIYSGLFMSKTAKFCFNDEEFDLNFNKEDEDKYERCTEDNNLIIFPLISNGGITGVLKIYFKKRAFCREFFMLLNTASKIISNALTNYILNEQMEVSLNFYSAMKDIAKIIESQYELNYIIPLIGEMIDRFMPEHLIYIFMLKNNEYKLVWPKACNEAAIYSMLKKINSSAEYILSEDGKIGIFPIVNEKGIAGAAAAYSSTDKLSLRDADYLVQLTRQAGLTIHRADMYAEVLKYAALDALTGLNNRRQFEIRIKQETANSRRNNTPLCGIMIDADYFKKVNDTYGHAAGDCVLKKISEIIMHEIREYDTAFRYGGEEFFILLPGAELKEALSAAERLRRAVEKTKIDIKTEAKKYINITISLGICRFDETMEAEEFVQLADKALYKAKSSGRNRTETV